MSKSSKTLIVYFSFDDGANREVERLRREIKADIIKLEPVKPYPSEYTYKALGHDWTGISTGQVAPDKNDLA